MAALTAGLVAGCSAGAPDPEPTADRGVTIEGLERFDDLSTEHVEGTVDYEQVPPVGGEHNARWLACDVYDEPVPPETAVHSMEHGGVWLTHRPDVDADPLVDLAAVNEEYVLVSPYEDLPSPVVATAWGVQLQVATPDDPRLREFVETYAGGDQGGEPGAPCRESGLTLEQAREAVSG